MVKNSDKDRVLEPVLVKNTFRNKNANTYINIAPFFDSVGSVGELSGNPMQILGEYLGKLARFVATLQDTEGALVFETQSEMVYTLFCLEEGLTKCTEINM